MPSGASQISVPTATSNFDRSKLFPGNSITIKFNSSLACAWVWSFIFLSRSSSACLFAWIAPSSSKNSSRSITACLLVLIFARGFSSLSFWVVSFISSSLTLSYFHYEYTSTIYKKTVWLMRMQSALIICRRKISFSLMFFLKLCAATSEYISSNFAGCSYSSPSQNSLIVYLISSEQCFFHESLTDTGSARPFVSTRI